MRKAMVAIEEWHETVGLTAVVAALASAGAEVDVLHIVEVGSGRSFAEADAAVAEAIDLLRARGVTACGHVQPMTGGSVVEQLAGQARALRAELVVMGSRGLGHVRGLVGQSVSHGLLAELDIPILILPDRAPMPLQGLRRALVAVGAEDDATAAVAAVHLLPDVSDVLAVHVPRRVALHAGVAGAAPFAEIGETSTVVLAEAHRRFGEAGIRVTTSTLDRAGGLAVAITGAARACHADLIVLGSRRPREWEAVVAGSTLHAVLHLSDRPVLIAGRPARPDDVG